MQSNFGVRTASDLVFSGDAAHTNARDPCASTVVGATKERNLWVQSTGVQSSTVLLTIEKGSSQSWLGVDAEAEPKRAAKAMLGTKRFVPIRVGFPCEAPVLQHVTVPRLFSDLQLNCSEFRCAKASKHRYHT